MELTGSISIRQPIEVVWAALNNEEILRQCITGCESLERIDAESLVAKLAVKLGPVRAKFNGKIKMSEVVPLQGYTLAFEGSGGAAGFAKGSSKITLQAIDTPVAGATASDKATLVSYTAQASVGGKLGQVGGRMIDATARSMADEFFKAFTQAIEIRTDAPSDHASTPASANPEVSLSAAAPPTLVPPTLTSAALASSPLARPQMSAALDQTKVASQPQGASDRGQRIYWFIGGMVTATILMLIGKHCL